MNRFDVAQTGMYIFIVTIMFHQIFLKCVFALQHVLRCWGPEPGGLKASRQNIRFGLLMTCVLDLLQPAIIEPSLALIGRSSNFLCKMLLGHVYASRSSVKSEKCGGKAQTKST